MLHFLKQVVIRYNHKPLSIFSRYINKNKWYKIKMNNKNISHRSDPVIMTLDSPEFKSLFTEELITLADIFKKYEFDIRIVGGAVRDILMNIQPKDLDFATNATPDQMKEMFNKESVRMINCNGEKHGTVTPRINTQNFEITTIRVDVTTNGRHAEVLFTTDWLLDANRRDLTINSLYLGLDGKVYDYFYGYDDLMKRRIKFVGNAAERICEDFLRILRYFRFYGRVCDVPDNHDDVTIKAIKDNVSGLEIISGERIWSEWTKILEGNFYKELTLKMLECGCGKYIGLPENPDYEEFNKVCLTAEKNNIKLRPITYITALLHTFDDVMHLFDRLKLTKYDRNLALFLVQNRNNNVDENSLKVYQKLVLKTTTKLSDAKEYVCEFFKTRGAVNLAEEFEKWDKKFPYQGHMILSYVDDKKMIANVLNKLKDLWVDYDYHIPQDDFEVCLPKIVQEVKNELQSGQNKEQPDEFGNPKRYIKKYGKRKLSVN